MGTVEPINNEEDADASQISRNVEIRQFLRGFVKKYKTANLSQEDIFNYLGGLVK